MLETYSGVYLTDEGEIRKILITRGAAEAAAALAARRHRIVALVAGVVVLASSLAATVLLGPGIWNAFLEGVRESGSILGEGAYPLHRMISPYGAII